MPKWLSSKESGLPTVCLCANSLLTEEEIWEEVLHVLIELILRRQQHRLVVEKQQQQVEEEKQDNASDHHLRRYWSTRKLNVLHWSNEKTALLCLAEAITSTVGMLSSLATTPASALRGFSKSDRPVRMP